ncbi:TolC family protein [Dorea sp. D27]|uniref:TolC family protein n=1 Tax=Dorea sp. D27 TaxID=658665 RepID=UPI0006736D87|nr:TolC family protein [Dorea sp. D27]KMZ53584.1 hypothetical protein HMPREF0980_02453 [Dorea sp. D27]
MRKSGWKKCLCVLCSVCICAGIFTGSAGTAEAGQRVLSLEQAKKLAYLSSTDYTKVKSKINLQKIKYTEAVKSIALKQKNMLTFRWSPLLKFKFPERPDMATMYDWLYKPMQIQTGLSSLMHQLEDVKSSVDEKVSNLYVAAYCVQEKITFAQRRLDSLNETLERNIWRVKAGKGAQADVDKIKAQVKKLTTDVSLLMRQSETAKKKLGSAVGLDLSWGFRFENPYVKGRLERDMLGELTEYTLSHDQGYYEAKLGTRAGLISLELNERLLKTKYNKYMSYIQPYINQARQGQKIDTIAFKAAYDQFLYALDSRWQGHIKILFIKIPKEWFKGALDGVRYIEDDPYAAYTQVLEYVDLKLEQDEKKREIEEAVSDQFEALITARNALDALQETVGDMETGLKKQEALNKQGKLSYDELNAQQEEYEESEAQMLDSLANYSSQLYSFDRLTCKGVTKYLEKGSLSVNVSEGGDSYLVQDEGEGAYYTLESRIEDNIFLFSVHIPEGFQIKATSYELWADGIQIGERTDAGEPLKHLALTLDDVQSAAIRFYDNEKFVDECEIDPMVTRGPLDIKGEYKAEAKKKSKKVADYTYTYRASTGTAEFEFTPVTGEGIAYYQMADKDGQAIYDKALVRADEPFRYLALAARDQKNLRIKFFDADKEILYVGALQPDTLEVTVQEE